MVIRLVIIWLIVKVMGLVLFIRLILLKSRVRMKVMVWIIML